jgi:hypothetical protein
VRTCRLVRNPTLCLKLPGTSCLLLFSETRDSARPFSSVLLHNQVNPRFLRLWFPIYSEERGDYWLRAGRPRGRISSFGEVKNFPSPRCPCRLWGPRTLLYDGYGLGALSSGVKRQGLKSRNVDLYIDSHIHLHDVLLN